MADDKEQQDKTAKEVVDKPEPKKKDEDNPLKKLQLDLAERDDAIATLKREKKEMENAMSKLQKKPEHKGFFQELNELLFGSD